MIKSSIASGVVLLVLLLGYSLISWLFAGQLLSLKSGAALEPSFADYDLPTPENVVIDNGSVKLAAWFFNNPKPANCAVIMLHGFTGDRNEVLPATPLFWQRGCHLLMYDARGHGQSTPSLPTYGVNEKFDELVALDWLSHLT